MGKRSDEDSEPSMDNTVVVGDTLSRRMKEAPKAPPCIVMLQGPAGYVGKQWPIDRTDIVIGRAMTCGVFIDDRSVSRSHAKLSLNGGDVFILDLESSNRTVVNEEPIPALTPIKLQDNDQIKTGNVVFKFLEQGNFEARAYETLQSKSEKDALTGIFNKGALQIQGNESHRRAKALKVPLSIAVFDIDHFKKVNDTYGHPAGDFVLKEMAQVIGTKLIRTDDYFARYGGEEFVVLLLGSNLQQAMEIGERLRTTIENHQFVYQGTKLPISISVGVATMEGEMSSWEELFAKADTALYVSKRSGRNRVTSA